MALENINSKDFKEMLDNEGENLEIIDVREKDEYDLIKIKGSKLIPLSEIGNSLDKIDWKKKVVFVCRSGSRSGYVAQVLAQDGKDVINLAGGVYELNLDDCDCLEKAAGCCSGYL